MNKTKQLIKIAIICLIIMSDGYAQTRDYVKNNMFWTETVLNGVIKNKWRYQVDYQYRRQAYNQDFEGKNHTNMFALPFQQVIRPWIHYQASPNLRFSLSPLGWWGTWNPSTSALGNRNYQPEFRICPQVTLIQKLARIEFSQRYRLEYRLFGTKTYYNDGDNIGAFTTGYTFPESGQKLRFRYFVRAIIPINHKEMVPKTFYTNIFNEIFISGGKNVANLNIFDQNRSFIGLGYKFNGSIRLEVGYLMQKALKFNNSYKNNIEQNNVLQFYLILENLKALFSKKKTD